MDLDKRLPTVGTKCRPKNGGVDGEKTLVKTGGKRFCRQKSGFAKVKIVLREGGFACRRGMLNGGK
jgi:hypothetical protein